MNTRSNLFTLGPVVPTLTKHNAKHAPPVFLTQESMPRLVSDHSVPSRTGVAELRPVAES